MRKIKGKSFEKLVTPVKLNGTFYPKKNEFIPYNLKLIDEYPHLIRDDDLAKVWFKYDQRFKQPKVYLTYQIETPHTYRSPKNYQLAKLYEAAVREGLNELVYPIKMAGLSYSLSTGKKGVVLTLSLIHISEPTRRTPISYAVFCLKKLCRPFKR